MAVTGSFAYLFLPWNLFLAFIPYWITGWIKKEPSILASKLKLSIVLGAWLLFIPNSFYIITDLFHLDRFNDAPKWFDLLLLFSFAWNGILCGVISLRRVEGVIERLRGKKLSVLLVFAVMWLNAFGIYIGRFLRFNSWDIITDPFSLAAEMIDMILHPFGYAYAWAMTVCYSVFMSFLYLTIKKLGESFSTGGKKDHYPDPWFERNTTAN